MKKKLLIKVISVFAMFIILIGLIMVGCDVKAPESAVASILEPQIPITEIQPTIISIEKPTTIEESTIILTEIEETEVPTESEVIFYEETTFDCIYTPSQFKNAGIIEWGEWNWTYYTSRILPGEDLYLPGRFTDENGYICDGDGYLCIASTALPWGTIVDTPFGRQGKVYDSGCDSYILDVYTNW